MNYETMYSRNSVRLLNYVTGVLGQSPENAQDVAGYAWMRAWEKREQFRGTTESEFRAWLFHIARNWLLQTKRRHCERCTEQMDASTELGWSVPARQELDLVNSQKVRRAFRHVTPHVQTLFIRAYIGGHSMAEIAADHGVTEGVIKLRINRAKARMAAR